MTTEALEVSLLEQALRDMFSTRENDIVDRQSPLLSIPRELRDMIYEMAFQDCVVKVNAKGKSSLPESIGLLLACKQTSSEALIIYYSSTTAESRHLKGPMEWAERLPHEYFRQIPQIRLASFAPNEISSPITDSGLSDE